MRRRYRQDRHRRLEERWRAARRAAGQILHPPGYVDRRPDQRELQALDHADIAVDNLAEVECDTKGALCNLMLSESATARFELPFRTATPEFHKRLLAHIKKALRAKRI